MIGEQEAPPGHGPISAAWVDVAVNAGQPARMAFTYAVPEGMAVSIGQAVFVPFGPRILQGIVLNERDGADMEGIRSIAAIADAEPVLDAAHIALARWMSERYLAPLWDCVATCLPSGYGQKSVVMVSPVDVPPLLPIYPKDRKILQYVAAHGRVSLDTLREAVGTVSMPTLQRLQAAGQLSFAQGLARPAGHAKVEQRVRRLRDGAELLAEAERLAESGRVSIAERLLRALSVQAEMTLTEARELGVTPKHLDALAANGWLERRTEQVWRDPIGARAFDTPGILRLSPDQQAVADYVAERPGETFLLHGVTGSGKTEVYLDLVARTLAAGKSAIVLVPEISLTPQAIRRYGERFADTLTVFHSGLNTGELFDQWHRVKAGGSRLILGSRSAVFAPARDLGLIVIDEEHEFSYKQSDPVPRYHAREAAAELSRLTGATLVLGSATPDIVTYHAAETGAISRVQLTERLQASPDGNHQAGVLPHITVVDMRDELRIGNRSVFSFALRRAVNLALAAGEQAILFVNRRGSARFILCRDCGFMPECPACRVTMSLDMRESIHAKLVCHYCGRSRKLEDRCPRCDSAKYRPFGVGTQRIELEAREQFPGARVARWDSDVAKHKGSHERIVGALEAREIDILVGTQMLAKGLDLPEMTVVGVVDADVGLGLPDYRAHERTFQLLSQVAGRAGRRERRGYVYFQTYQPEAAPIICAAEHDYRSFYEQEIAHRRLAGYPPFSRMLKLVYRNSNEDAARDEASRVAEEIRVARDVAGRWEPDVLGPTPSYVARLRGEYRFQLVLRGRDPASGLQGIRLGEKWSVDVDPVNLL